MPDTPREGDQPLPTINDHPDIQSMVVADISQRRLVGIERYGTALQPFNGRDGLQDAYEEALDLTMYLKQLIVERDETVRLEFESHGVDLRAFVDGLKDARNRHPSNGGTDG